MDNRREEPNWEEQNGDNGEEKLERSERRRVEDEVDPEERRLVRLLKAVQNNAGKGHVDVPMYQGKMDSEEVLGWLDALENYFEYEEMEDDKRIRVDDAPVADNSPVEEENVAVNPPIEDEGLIVAEGATGKVLERGEIKEEFITQSQVTQIPSTAKRRKTRIKTLVAIPKMYVRRTRRRTQKTQPVGNLVEVIAVETLEEVNVMEDEIQEKVVEDKLENLVSVALQFEENVEDILEQPEENMGDMPAQNEEKTEDKTKEEEKEKETRDAPVLTSKTPRYVQKNHSIDQIIRDKNKGIITKRKVSQEQVLLCLLSEIEPKLVEEACNDQNSIKVMREELD
ncbi:uncharacterized protein LOC131860153 [Cryptomeria japonica]|uniref:uncharacterized protein LOC131860153 n=1 Tax=Cryptomeria japonica TaxID=3369 RepID=UPI0027D9F83E|nr:uncharacterized protein LOC131860153 [Cryptomeria japonica]